MALIGKIATNIRSTNIISVSSGFHTSCCTQINQKWRKDNRLPRNPNAFGPLTNLPDYSFADGKPTPFGIRQYGRIQKQREYLTKIRKLAGEIDYAVERHARIQKEKEDERRRILDSKLKPKGQLSLNEPTKNGKKMLA